MTSLDLLGWVGTVCSVLFYLYLSKRKVIPAYMIGAVGAIVWLAIGCILNMWSLVVKEIVILWLIIAGFVSWRDGTNA